MQPNARKGILEMTAPKNVIALITAPAMQSVGHVFVPEDGKVNDATHLAILVAME